ncbi:MAG: nitrate/nitrite transporter NrtS [Planctomycetota bacterium]
MTDDFKKPMSSNSDSAAKLEAATGQPDLNGQVEQSCWTATVSEAFAIATEWKVIRRSLLFALGVGSILIAINHGSGLLAGHADPACLVRCGLTMLVPYCVSTLSCVLTRLDLAATCSK